MPRDRTTTSTGTSSASPTRSMWCGRVSPTRRASGWTLYRVPLRTPTAVIGTPNIRLVQALRVTLVAPPAIDDIVARLALTRLTFVGAPWLARAPAPIEGIAGSTAEPTGSVVVSVISTLDKTLGYIPPPGVLIGLNNLQADPNNNGVGDRREVAARDRPRSCSRARERRRISASRPAASASCRTGSCGCGCGAATTSRAGTPATCWATSRWRATPTTSTCTRRPSTASARK